ncbi:MAG: PTS fructose transporter subunit IIB, partial [Bombilactobacillus sp.]
MKIVAITSCSTGIAHTYMAAENLETTAKKLGVEIKVETQGSIGVENALTSAEIAAADGVIIAASTSVNKDRFSGKKLLDVDVTEAVDHPKELFERVKTAPVYQGNKDSSNDVSIKSTKTQATN